jgi:DNA-binding MarR family transcriptional regulator
MVAFANNPEHRPNFLPVIRLLARLARVAEQACQSTGISLPQYRLLLSISGQPQRASELAAAVGVSRPTLTSLVDGLEHCGFLQRLPVPNDRRGIQLVPTGAGREAVARAEGALLERLSRLVDRDVARLVHEVSEALARGLGPESEHEPLEED